MKKKKFKLVKAGRDSNGKYYWWNWLPSLDITGSSVDVEWLCLSVTYWRRGFWK